MGGTDLPADVLETAERLTRLARSASDTEEAQAYRADRDATLAEHGYEAHEREDADKDILVVYPADWIDDGVILVETIDDRSRAIEIPLSGTGSADNWDAVASHNRAVATAVEAEHGAPHAATARALADFASNHYAKPIEKLTRSERQEFKEEYFERNVWPSAAQREHLEESVELTISTAGEKSSNL